MEAITDFFIVEFVNMSISGDFRYKLSSTDQSCTKIYEDVRLSPKLSKEDRVKLSRVITDGLSSYKLAKVKIRLDVEEIDGKFEYYITNVY